MKLPVLILLALAAAITLARSQAPAEQADPAKPPPPTPKKWKMIPEFSDEFNGTELNQEKWVYGIDKWRGREPGLNIPENVTVKDGCLCIAVAAGQDPRMDGGYRDYTTGALSSANRIRYGFFETRAKIANACVSSSFWLSRNAEDNWTEIDVFEMFGKSSKAAGRLHSNVHAFKALGVETHQESPNAYELSFDPAAAFHVYGLMWDAVTIKWLVDGKTVRQKPNIYWKYPLHVIFDSEIMHHWVGEPDKTDLPSLYQVDYIRVWQADR